MRKSLLLNTYLGLTRLARRPVEHVLKRRLDQGKEDPERWREKLGEGLLPRPVGPLIWMHAASVGESVSLLDLITALLDRQPQAHILLTTGTVTSAELMGERLPERALHQFAPVDTAAAVSRFLDHWKPDVAIWTESELWPRLITETHARDCPMFLINARMSENSARRMRKVRGMASALLQRFKLIMAQDATQADRFRSLGMPTDRIEVTGSLKDTASALPYDDAALKEITKDLAGRPCWLAASTHEGEEVAIALAHERAQRSVHGLVLVLVPRHPHRGPGIAEKLRTEGWRVAVRSAEEPLARDTEIYLADTLGELGLWYRLCPVSFVGGSLVDVGGHNPFEPAHLGSAILHGPYVSNFAGAYERFDAAGAAVNVATTADLGVHLIETLAPDRAAALARAAWQVASEGAVLVNTICELIETHLPASRS